MINFDDVTKNKKKPIKEHNPNSPVIPDHPYRIQIVGGIWVRRKQMHYLI